MIWGNNHYELRTPMPTLSSLQVPPPKTWQEFETLCCDLWRSIWKDPNAQKNGRQGQAQHGVDVFGRPSQQTQWAGVQCKGKDNYTDKALTDEELRNEAEKAKSFTPSLSHFIVATTGPRDANIQKVARLLSDDLRRAGLFAVDVWSWEDIVEVLDQHPEVVAKHYPQFALTATVRVGFDQIHATQRESLSRQAQTSEEIKSLTSVVSQVEQKVTLPDTMLAVYHDNALDLARDYINQNKPALALDFLEQQRTLIWSQATPQTKSRLLMAMGAAKLGLGEERRAAELFLEAVHLTPDDEKANCNAAVACFLLDDCPQALNRANKVLEKNPANYQARSIAIQASSEPLDDIVAGVPPFCNDNRDVTFALGAVARRHGNPQEAVRWYRAAAKGSDCLPDIKAALAHTLLELIQDDPQSPLQVAQVTDHLRGALAEVETLLTEAWTAMCEDHSRRSRISWVINRGVVRRLLGKSSEAQADFEEALRLTPSHPVATYLCATLVFENGDSEKALAMASTIQNFDDVPATPLFVADLLLVSKDPDDALAYLESSLKRGLPQQVDHAAQLMLVEAHQRRGDLESASSLCNSLVATAPSDVRVLVTASQIHRAGGEAEIADTFLAKAMRCVSSSIRLTHGVVLAEELYSLKRFDDAASVYERVVQPDLDTPLTRRYLNACYQANRLDKALEVCDRLYQRHGALRYVAEVRSAIFEETGDLDASRRACEEYLSVAPGDAMMRVRLAVVHLRQRNSSALDAFLSDPPDWKSLPVEFAIQIANLFAVRERYREATELLYEIRRLHPSGKVHLRYLQSFLFHGDTKHDWLETPVIGLGSAVCIEDAAGKPQWFILEGSHDARIEVGEITSSHRLWSELIGKTVGDSIVFRESQVSPEPGRIVEIKSKYVHAFHECGEILQTRYPEVKGFEAVHLPKDEVAGIKKILDQVGRQHDAQRNAIQVYQENPVPVAALAHALGRDVFEAWSAVVNSQDARLRCCMGNTQERNFAIDLLHRTPKPVLVIDPISLMTVVHLGVRDEACRIAGRFGIAQATIDLLSDTLHKRRAVNRSGFLTIGKEGDQFVKQEVSAEEVERQLAWLEDLLGWITANCDVLAQPASVTMDREKRKQLADILGDESLDSILVATGDGRILYSDDQWLRGLAKGEFGVDGLWTQVLLGEGLERNAISREQYNQAVVSLVCAGYVHTGIDANVLLAAAKRAEWRPVWPFDCVADTLRGPSCDEASAIRVAADFLSLLWGQVILPKSFDYLALRLLDALAHRRTPGLVARRLLAALKGRFLLNPIAEEDVSRLIAAWGQMRIM